VQKHGLGEVAALPEQTEHYYHLFVFTQYLVNLLHHQTQTAPVCIFLTNNYNFFVKNMGLGKIIVKIYRSLQQFAYDRLAIQLQIRETLAMHDGCQVGYLHYYGLQWNDTLAT